jgi:hypothetical protein
MHVPARNKCNPSIACERSHLDLTAKRLPEPILKEPTANIHLLKGADRAKRIALEQMPVSC